MECKCKNGNLRFDSDKCECEKDFEGNNKCVLSSQNDESLCTEEKLKLSSWELPEKILQFYHNKGITHMFQWQLECLTLGRVLNAGNLVYSAPTSAGKTLVAEILISKSICELQKKALMILPFVSVVREKMFYFQGMYSSSGINVEGYMGGHSPSISFKQVHLAVCTIEKANSIINRLLEENSLHNLGLVVVDELHLLGDPYRGYLLELLLTKLKYISQKSDQKIQIVGMSATLPNLKSLADWLNADLYYTDFRPVPLNEKLKCGNTMFDKKLNKLYDITPLAIDATDDSENVAQFCYETIANGHSILIFCPTKIWCENLADKISLFFRKLVCSPSAETEGTPGWILRKELNLNKINEVLGHLKMSPVGLDKDLHKTVSCGIAFHHAGLTLDERDIIEGSFRKGSIRVLCATSTLSSGVNLPARRVIIRSPMSFGGLMDILTYRQMIGRAGRMGVDSEGESILICKPNEKSMCQTLMCSNLKPIESCLGHGRLSASLKRALLEIVASGIACTPEDVKDYASCTFLACSSKHDIEDPIQSCLEFLEENEFIRLQDNGNIYVPTPLAKACLASSLPPDEGLALFRELQRARRCFVLDTDLHIIYQVTPYSVSEQWSKVDWLNVLSILEGLPPSMKRVGEMVGVEEGFIVRIVKGSLNPNAPENRNKLSIHRRFYTSLALQDLVNEVPLSKVSEKYDCNKGMLQSLQQSAATYAGMVTEFTKCLGWNSIELIFSQFQERLQFGVQRELCELMRLPLLNAMRARALYNAGFTNLPAIANANVNDLENVFFGMAPFQSKKEIAGETTYDREQRNKLQAVWITGKADLTIRDAVELLITESRKILEVELGFVVKWGETSLNTSLLHKTTNSQSNRTILNKSIVNCEKSVKQTSVIIQDAVKDISEKSVKQTSVIIQDAVKDISEKSVKQTSVIIQDAVKDISEILETEIVDKTDKILPINECVNNIDKNEENNKNLNKSNSQDNVDENLKKIEPKIIQETQNQELIENESINDKEEKCLNHDNSKILEKEHKCDNEGEKKEIDYFASSFNFDLLPAYEAVSKATSNKNVDIVLEDSDSNNSVEILYDSTIHNASKNLSFSRLSDDMFEISKRGNGSIKNMSTPIAVHGAKKLAEQVNQSRLLETGSPDLFSQSLTFDTQIRKILDFEERSADDNPLIINPSSSINSDDLGFVSDLSPAKQEKIKNVDKNSELEKAGVTNSLLENGFKTLLEEKKVEATKRKLSVDSPDLISTLENPSKKAKRNTIEDKEIFLSPQVRENESDDEIIATPKLDKTHLSDISKIRCRNNSQKNSTRTDFKKTNQRSIALLKSTIKVFDTSKKINIPVAKVDQKVEKVKWDKINVIDVCSGEEEFKLFFEDLKEQNIVGLALGCRRKLEENKNIIGSKITKRKKIENLKETSFNCQYKDIVLDGIAFYWKENDVFYMSMDDGNIPLSNKINLLKLLDRKEIILRVFDAKEQIKMLHRCCSVTINSSYQDPKVALWLLAENWKDKNFSTLTIEYLPTSKTLLSTIGSIVGYSSPGLLVRSNTSPKTRASVEAFLTYHTINQQLPLLLQKGLRKVYDGSEMPIMLSLAEMELAGFQVCRNALSNCMEKLDEVQSVLENKAYALAGQRFTISSSLAVSKVLSKLLSTDKDNILLTKKKKLPSTSKQALQKLANDTKHPLPEIILMWRKIRSVTTKFISPLLQITTDSNKVYGVSQTFTVTGRISMYEPNLQNIPKKFSVTSDENETVEINLREVFIPSADCLLVSVDFCQIELRMLAHLSQDSDLINNIKGCSDIFVNIAANVFGIATNDIDENLRQRAKQTSYGIIYGIGPQTLAEQLEISESDAFELIDNFKNKYKGVKDYLGKIINECRKNGYVTTLLNRRRYIFAINDSNPAVRMEAERQAINTTIQGSAADLVKTAMILCREKLRDTFGDKVTTRLVLHLHDELIFEVEKDAIETAILVLKEQMENAMELIVPTPVKIKVGSCWGRLEEFEA